MKRIYLDYAATTPVRREVFEAMSPYFTDSFGNPSAVHSYGQEAKQAIETGREQIARLINAKPEEIVFTSGGTEADNFAITGAALACEGKKNHIVTTTIEHPAVIETCKSLEKQGWKVTYLAVDQYGLVNPDDVEKAITGDTLLVSVMHANNEIGTIQPIEEIGKITREKGVYFHTDAVQTAGRVPIDVHKLGVDLLAISAHKVYGPKGTGVLYIKEGTRLTPLIHGGGQEGGRRSTTENVPGIVGFGKAVEMAQSELADEAIRLTELRDKLIKGLVEGIERVELNGHPLKRLPNNVNIIVDRVEGESVVLLLDLEGICASSGSACHSASIDPSHVLLAIGRPHQQAHGSLRLTLGKWTTEEDVDRVLQVLPKTVAKLRAISPLL